MDKTNAPRIRLIALDLDGTLFNEQKVIPPRTLEVLQAAMHRGVAVVPATGRPISGLPKALMALHGLRYALTSNGSRVMDLETGKALVEFSIPRDVVRRTIELLWTFDAQVSLFCDGQRICRRADVEQLHLFIPPNMVDYVKNSGVQVENVLDYALDGEHTIEKINAFFTNDAERQRAWKALDALGLGVVITSSLPLNMEINAPGVTKGRGLMALAEHLGLDRAQVMACGDSGNDLDMIRRAGLGVAMANATPPVLEAADYVTLSNEEEGVAAAVEKFVL